MTKGRERWALIACAAVAAVVFLPSLGNGFVYDDVRIIVEREDLHSLGNWRGLLAGGWWSNALYRPVTLLSLAVNWAMGGGDPWVFHLVNVMAHAAATALLWVLARRWLSLSGATVAGLVFAVHPVHVEAVANVVGRAEVFAGLFTLAAALCYRWDGELRDRAVSGWRRWASAFGTLAFVALALGSKESAFAVPGVLLIVDWMESRRLGVSFEERVRGHGLLWAASVALTVEWLMLRGVVLGDFAGDDPGPGLLGEGLIGRALVMAPVVLQYLRLLFVPARLSADYSPNFLEVAPELTVTGTLGLLAVGALTGAAVVLRTRAPIVTFALAWIGGTLLVVSNVLVPTGVLLAERSMYLPSVGAALLFGAAATGAWRSHRTVVTGVVAVVLGLGSVRTVSRIPMWRDNDSFFPQFVMDAPGSFRSMWVGAQLLFMQDRPVDGEVLLREAINVYPFFPNTWQDLGRQMQLQERWEDAAQAFHVAFSLQPRRLYDASAAITNYVKAGLLDSARTLAGTAQALDPHEPLVLIARAGLARAEERTMRAMTLTREAAWWSGDNAYYWYLTALAALEASYCPEAVRSAERVARIDPEYRALPGLRSRLGEQGCE